jgi:hypothetical protein
MTDELDRTMTQRRLRRSYRVCFETEEGSGVLDDLRRFCHYETPVYVQGDATATAYQDGMRRVFLRILQLSKDDENHVAALSQEQA